MAALQRIPHHPARVCVLSDNGESTYCAGRAGMIESLSNAQRSPYNLHYLREVQVNAGPACGVAGMEERPASLSSILRSIKYSTPDGSCS